MNQAQHEFDETIRTRRTLLAEYLHQPMHSMAESCLQTWGDVERLNQALQNTITSCNANNIHCNLLYVVDKDGNQISDNHRLDGNNPDSMGQDLSHRPYFKNMRGEFRVSNVYVSKNTQRSCVSAVHHISRGKEILGYVVADFPLSALPQAEQSPEDRQTWLQMKGDPSIRSTLFMQTRTISEMDENLDDVLNIIEELIIDRGVFHAKLHYSSSRATLWLYDDPYRYRIHTLEEILNDACLAYPRKPYPKEAIVSKAEVRQALDLFKILREADETVYLRASSLNIINGFVALNFSCDGSHYIPVHDFLEKDSEFWFGETN